MHEKRTYILSCLSLPCRQCVTFLLPRLPFLLPRHVQFAGGARASRAARGGVLAHFGAGGARRPRPTRLTRHRPRRRRGGWRPVHLIARAGWDPSAGVTGLYGRRLCRDVLLGSRGDAHFKFKQEEKGVTTVRVVWRNVRRRNREGTQLRTVARRRLRLGVGV